LGAAMVASVFRCSAASNSAIFFFKSLIYFSKVVLQASSRRFSSSRSGDTRWCGCQFRHLSAGVASPPSCTVVFCQLRL
jgi:hypothetical protein